jgi:hypothetical protein
MHQSPAMEPSYSSSIVFGGGGLEYAGAPRAERHHQASTSLSQSFCSLIAGLLDAWKGEACIVRDERVAVAAVEVAAGHSASGFREVVLKCRENATGFIQTVSFTMWHLTRHQPAPSPDNFQRAAPKKPEPRRGDRRG